MGTTTVSDRGQGGHQVGNKPTVTGSTTVDRRAPETASLVGLSPFQFSSLLFLLGRWTTIAIPCEAMLKVLVHHLGVPANPPFHSKSRFHLLLHLLSQPFLLSFLLLTFATVCVSPVTAAAEGVIQAPKDPDGLSVIDSPTPDS